TGPQSIHILRGVRQQQDEPGRFSICSRQAAVVLSVFSRFVIVSYGLTVFNAAQRFLAALLL
ncbi:hypothetical protein SMA33_24465, partial [Escherichia coli]|uniref:hypothetical protein n=1 Tax=Escherichia coli TaxID=562 RepID=UPI003079DC55